MYLYKGQQHFNTNVIFLSCCALIFVLFSLFYFNRNSSNPNQENLAPITYTIPEITNNTDLNSTLGQLNTTDLNQMDRELDLLDKEIAAF